MVTAVAAEGAKEHAKKKAAQKAQNTVKSVSDTKPRNLIGNSPKSWEPRSVAGYRRILTMEFMMCTLIIAYRGWKNKNVAFTSTGNASVWRQLGAVWLVFFILALLSSISWKVAKICAGLGGVITLVVMIQQSDMFVSIADSIKNSFGYKPVQGQDAVAPHPFIDQQGASQ